MTSTKTRRSLNKCAHCVFKSNQPVAYFFNIYLSLYFLPRLSKVHTLRRIPLFFFFLSIFFFSLAHYRLSDCLTTGLLYFYVVLIAADCSSAASQSACDRRCKRQFTMHFSPIGFLSNPILCGVMMTLVMTFADASCLL